MKELIPNAVSVIVPTRISMPNENLVLTNDISINIIKSCFVNTDREDVLASYKHFRFFERLQRTTVINNEIRSSLETLFNFFLIKHLVGILPVEIMRPLIATYSTMGFSNVKGIQKKVHIQNHPVSNMTFWIPNKYCVSLLSFILTYV